MRVRPNLVEISFSPARRSNAPFIPKRRCWTLVRNATEIDGHGAQTGAHHLGAYRIQIDRLGHVSRLGRDDESRVRDRQFVATQSDAPPVEQACGVDQFGQTTQGHVSACYSPPRSGTSALALLSDQEQARPKRDAHLRRTSSKLNRMLMPPSIASRQVHPMPPH